MKLSRVLLFACLLLIIAVIFAASPHRASEADSAAKAAEGARLNNIGVAYMNQQLFEKALKQFETAVAQDPKMLIAKLNCGVALLNLQKVDEAKSIFEEVTKQDPKDAHAWYNLGTAYAQAKRYPQAIEAFEHALKLNPLHASAEFGISRAYQQSGDIASAREHLQKSQHITQAKLGTPIGLAYGDQGKYSLVEESPAAVIKPPAQIRVKFADVTERAGLVTQPPTSTYLGPGACFFDYDNDGWFDIFLPGSGSQGGISLYHNLGNGKFQEVTKQAGFDPSI